MMRRVTTIDIQAMKARGEKIPMVTAYDAPTACLADAAGFPMVLVGDSLGMVVMGHESTIPVTMEDMVRHAAAVSRRARRALIVADMPFMSFHVNASETVRNAGRLVQEGGAQVVKLEGGVSVAEEVRRVVESGIPVMGHIGLTPQSVNRFGGYKVQGKVREEAKRLLEDAMALQEAGAFAVVLELMPSALAKLITERLSIPTIGIGAGPHCDGQVQVFHDIMGFFDEFVPKHTKQYLRLNELVSGALKQYADEVKEGAFPTEKEGFAMDESALEGL